MNLGSILEKMGLSAGRRCYSEAKIEEAEVDNALRDHETAIRKIEETAGQAQQSNHRLRETIEKIKAQFDGPRHGEDVLGQMVSDMRRRASQN